MKKVMKRNFFWRAIKLFSIFSAYKTFWSYSGLKFELIILDHPPKSWSIDKGPRVQGFKGSSEKALKTNK